MSISDDLASLESQHARGALSDEEFAAAKKRLLDGGGSSSSADANQWGMFVHLSLLLGTVTLIGFVVPILLWQMKKDEFPVVDAHGKIAANWILSALIYGIVFGILVIFIIGIPLLIVLAIVSFLYPIIGGIKANSGEIWSYPGSIRFF